MGTNVSANLFTAAPAAPQGNVNVQKNVNKAFEGRKATSGKQGKDFSSELKDVTKEDKLADLTKEAVETPVADKPVQQADKVEAKPEGDKFAEGIELILAQLKKVLDKNKVVEIKALGEPFDPNYHNAVMTEEVEDTEAGIVTKVMQKGYTLNGKVIRPSMVCVSR